VLDHVVDQIAVCLFMVVLIAIPVFAIVYIPYAVEKCSRALRRARRPFRLRVRLWQLMTAVLILGTLTAIVMMSQRALHARRTAEDHAIHARVCRWMLGREKLDTGFFKIDSAPLDGDPGLVEYFQSLEQYHEGLSRKYYGVARRPWLTVSADAPKPEMPAAPAIMGREYVNLVKQLDNCEQAMARSMSP
jgi:hypothetical protein